MRIDPKYVKLASAAVLSITGLIVVSTVVAAAASAMFITAVQYFGTLRGRPLSEVPLGFYQGVLIVSAILLPAIFLIRFYIKAVFHCPSRSYFIAGWSTSALYHAGLTFILIRYVQGASLGVYGLSVPFWSLAGLALLLSAFLAVYNQRSRSENLPPPVLTAGHGV